MKDYKVIISDDDKKAIEGLGIKLETIIVATQRAIWRIKSVRADRVDFMERFEEDGKPFILHGNIRYYRKKGYILEFQGIGEIKAFYNRKTGEVQYFGEQEISDVSDKE
ncbi:hypothetical protein [Pseudobacteroides cellulosolvens]|uniref:Uncharacterized protein n=1 Tax=Pseudobacteroides cellulosolvens ATCC 35603 = DSM 2933 TaxID=398512 RepID=A0A0L6JIH6_9FIRM|nr:hypothetical protein [Pseudobacteroides cellulosolvens]KNY25498.1 hypothetical protein Bccel_0758 [Pseudobacteroides cellulosolvens ATCC 35603 = DSM 2933]